VKILNWFIKLISKTIGLLHLPFVDKSFPLSDYFEIEKHIRGLESPFVVGAVKINGHGSNILIGLVQSISSKGGAFKVTHALAHIGLYNGFKHRVVQSVGSGIKESSLLEAIGQRDTVVLRRPNPKVLNSKVCEHALEYLHAVAKRDAQVNIEYDNVHDYSEITIEQVREYSNKNVKMDCSETVMQAINHGFKMTNQKSLINMVNRAGKESWAPSDLYNSKLFITFYDSKKGFINS